MLAETTEGELAAYTGDISRPALRLSIDEYGDTRMDFGRNFDGIFKLRAGLSFPIPPGLSREQILIAEAQSYNENLSECIALFLQDELIYEGKTYLKLDSLIC